MSQGKYSYRIKVSRIVDGPPFKDFFFKSDLFGNSEAIYFTLAYKADEHKNPGIHILIKGLIRPQNGRGHEDTYIFTGIYSPHMSISTDPVKHVIGMYNTRTRKGLISESVPEADLKDISLNELIMMG
jgi:hypothetical protein